MKKLAIFVSGSGSNFQSIIDGIADGLIDAEIKLCISSQKTAYALDRAKDNDIPAFVFSKNDYKSPEEMFEKISALIDENEIDYMILAGYMTVLPPFFVKKYPKKIINIHPALIPKYCGRGYYGLKVHKAVIEANETESGVTVHYVDEGVDTGDIIKQIKVPVMIFDTPETLAQRILSMEHLVLRNVVADLCNEKPLNKDKIKRALLSVSDKTGVVDFAKELEALGYQIVSTGGTLSALLKYGVKAVNISDITGFRECLDGRVKTLHPVVHAGILAMRGNPDHMRQINELGIAPIDVVAINLYPFKATIEKADTTLEHAIENIDIGGPTMLRSAAKNYQDVYVVCDSSDYKTVITELKSGESKLETKFNLMYKVFQHTAYYDTLIAGYMREKLNMKFPPAITFAYDKVQDMRYGENPTQDAAFYKESFSVHGSLPEAEQLLGKELSYNNINDANGALDLLREFGEPAVIAVKHANPCGAGIAANIYDAYIKAYESDPVSIFGGIVAANRRIDLILAKKMAEIFLEIIIAPDFSDEAVAYFAEKRKNLRLLKLKSINTPVKKGTFDMKKVLGGLLIQDFDNTLYNENELTVVTEKKPSEELMRAMEFGFKVVKHTKSNAIVVSNSESTLGIGMGQTNRIWAAQEALSRAGERANGAILASDAFFPFPDCVQEAKKYGIAAIIQPGGSVNDQMSIDACNEVGIAMVFCKQRHFKH